ncbi:MAG: hypothetical protein AAGJ83_13320 [Planctomycetota bacterium]
MVLNLHAANQYNHSRDYSDPLIRIIRREIGAQERGPMGSETTKAVHHWQQHQLAPKLNPDGMFGPKSLGKLIQSLDASGRNEEVAIARRFPYHDFGAAAAAETNILEFRALLVSPIKLRSKGTGWACKGKFRVIIRFHPDIDASRYEYRQYIKGSASTQRGHFTGTTPTTENWRAIYAAVDQSDKFKVPGGLSNSFKEDGFQSDGGKVESYGYRRTRGTRQTDETPEDRYLPNQSSGHTYRCNDCPGLEGTNGRPSGLRIRQTFTFQGRIIDTHRDNQIVATRHWRLEGDHILT